MVWMFWRREKSLVPTGIGTLNHLVLVLSLYQLHYYGCGGGGGGGGDGGDTDDIN
jgi:hypothetical protein